MTRAVVIDEYGGPEVLQWRETAAPVAGTGELVVELHAAGVNFVDTYHRTGLYRGSLPLIPGMEGSGKVVEVGPGAAGWAVGDRAAWAAVLGSYAEMVIVPADAAVHLPPEVDLDTAAAIMLQGLTAQYLTTSTFALMPGHRCLIHAGAGGVGLLLIQMAKRIGAEVFTTVGDEEKARIAFEAGADHVILYRAESFSERIAEVSGPRSIDVVYDGVGASVFEESLSVIRPRGLMVTFGNASGPVPPVSPLTLSTNGSLFLTRPTLKDYITPPDELMRRSAELFSLMAAGINVRIDSRIPLAEAEEAHRRLEGRRTSGKILLTPG